MTDVLILLKRWDWLFDRSIDSELITLRCKVDDCGYTVAFSHHGMPEEIRKEMWEHFNAHSQALVKIRA